MTINEIGNAIENLKNHGAGGVGVVGTEHRDRLVVL
jgi:hypothetical protein